MKKNISVVHLTSAHPRDDIRIFRKMCMSLATNYDVSLVVADGRGNDDICEEVSIFDVGVVEGRISRMTKTTHNVYLKALELDAELYHLHDPELMPIALKLKKKGVKVIFDCHEDLPKQLKSKPYLNGFLKFILPKIFSLYEKFVFSKLDAVIGATPIITEKLSKINDNAVNVNNYPILGELEKQLPWKYKMDEVCYLGGIARIRGASEIVKAMGYLVNIKLNLAGDIGEQNLAEELKSLDGWNNVNELGFVNRAEAADTLSKSKAGIVTFLPVPNHIDAQPNKMFEYMSAGIPVIGSNYQLWKDIIEGNDCGLCVNPEDPKEIADAINFLISNPDIAEKMGANGLKAVYNIYNWKIEEEKLITLYQELLND